MPRNCTGIAFRPSRWNRQQCLAWSLTRHTYNQTQQNHEVKYLHRGRQGVHLRSICHKNFDRSASLQFLKPTAFNEARRVISFHIYVPVASTTRSHPLLLDRSFHMSPLLYNDDAENNSKKEYSTPQLTNDAEKHKAGLKDPDVPPWQNPLHHDNKEMQKMFPEDFESREEFEKAIIPPPPPENDDGSVAAPAYIHEIAEEIVHLNMLEMSELINKIGDHFGFNESTLTPDDDSQGGSGDGMDVDDDDSSGATAAPVEKTTFDIKLVQYDASAKIKIIKEVRSLASLGLKEAKDMVESVPKTILKDMKKEQAEEIKAKLEELGATVEIV
jgi:large subunit ribosomal protein L7/L12